VIAKLLDAKCDAVIEALADEARAHVQFARLDKIEGLGIRQYRWQPRIHDSGSGAGKRAWQIRFRRGLRRTPIQDQTKKRSSQSGRRSREIARRLIN